VCGFSEIKRAECLSENAERRRENRGASATVGIAAGAGPIRFAAATLSMADDAASATSMHGPQWGDETEFAMTEVA
jgi:hypothetical protein